MFQSHNGAIAAITVEGAGALSISFQSHNGAIAAGSLGLILEASSSFQSHNGAIAAENAAVAAQIQLEFQSHNGAIAAEIATEKQKTKLISFNPTMVRLLPANLRNRGRLSAKFQSHNGAIAAFERKHERCPQGLVSIPQWCDCCLGDKESKMR